MKVLFIASEATPFVKTGGLGDVIGSLPIQMAKEEIDIRVILPFYRDIPDQYKKAAEPIANCTIKIGWREQQATILKLEHSGVLFYFIDQPYYFDRSGLYGYYDDGERFSFFAQAALEIIEKIDFIPDVLHLHDWHTALIPMYLKDFYQTQGRLEKLKTIFTIHNLAYQGNFSPEMIEDVLGLGWDYFTEEKLEFHGSVNMMKGGILYADAVTTVSETYALEIQSPERGEGLHNILKENSIKLCGIVNGIDYESYNPNKDTALCARYQEGAAGEWRAKNKKWLWEKFKFSGSPNSPLIGMVSRIAKEKGFDLVCEAMPDIIASGAKLIILGVGDQKYEERLRQIAEENPGSLVVVTEFNDQLARNIYGGSDIFFMPSVFEPCGISQMIAMRYGSIPFVRKTGGLKDTVIPYDKATGTGTGFSFDDLSRLDCLAAYKEVLATYQDKKAWGDLIEQAMAKDFSWSESVKKYADLYQRVVKGD